jgi:predicted ATPase
MRRSPGALPRRFPFTVPAVRRLSELVFDHPVTLFVGENGTGKSTLLEAIAAGIGAVALGGEALERDDSLAAARELGGRLQFTWNRRSHRGFFLRAEDFFRFARRVRADIEELDRTAEGFADEMHGDGLQRAQGAVRGQRAALVRRYGADPDAASHGECFLRVFGERFVPGGLYLLDEPEAPLSPQRQLAFLAMVLDMARNREAQFIIATHSPVLMAFPDATLYSFDTKPIRPVAYDDVEHVAFLRDFLRQPEAFLRHL